MKRVTLGLVAAIVLAVLFGIVLHANGAEAEIVSATVTVRSSVVGTDYAWFISGKNGLIPAKTSGRECRFIMPPGSHQVVGVVATPTGLEKFITTVNVSTGGTPIPPDDPVVPDDPVLPQGKFGLAPIAYAAAKALPATHRSAVAANYEKAAASMTSITEGNQLVSAANKASLGADISKWASFGKTIAAKMTALMDAGTMEGVDDVKAAFLEIAVGLKGGK